MNTTDSRRSYHPCVISTPVMLPVIGRVEVAMVLLAKAGLLLAGIVMVLGLSVAGVKVWQRVYHPKVSITARSAAEIEENVSKVDDTLGRLTLATVHANFRLTNTAVLNSLLQVSPSGPRVNLNKFQLRAYTISAPVDVASGPAASRRRAEAKIGYRVIANWGLDQPSSGPLVMKLTAGIIEGLRPDLRPDSPWNPWTIEYSQNQSQAASASASMGYSFEVVADLRSPDRIYSLKKGQTPADARAALTQFHQGRSP